MQAPLNQVIFPSSFTDLFAAWNRFPNAIPYAGGTNIIGKQEKNVLDLPPVFLSLDEIPEMHRITRTEQYLEIGSMVNLNKLLDLGKIVPNVLRTCIKNIAGVQLRNIATIGGNICSTTRLLDIPAPLCALDAQYELRDAQTSRWVSSSRFHSTDETSLKNQEILTRIRLPLHQWNYEIYKKFFCEDYFYSEVLVFLARAQKNVLNEIKVIFKGNSILRNKNGEDILNGKYLPFPRKTADEFVQNWAEFLAERQEISEFSKNSLLNSIEENVLNLSE